jgi:hypothetical protein
VEHDVEAVVAHRVADRVRFGLVLMLAVQSRCDAVIEGECIPGKTAVRSERGGYAFKRAASVSPRLVVPGIRPPPPTRFRWRMKRRTVTRAMPSETRREGDQLPVLAAVASA